MVCRYSVRFNRRNTVVFRCGRVVAWDTNFFSNSRMAASRSPGEGCALSVGGMLSFVTDTNRERCPGNVILRKVEDLDVQFRLDLVWRRADRLPTLKAMLA